MILIAQYIIALIMPVNRLTSKERKEKNKEDLKNISNECVQSKKLLQSLRKKKTATICFDGNFYKLIELCEAKKREMLEIDKELSVALKNMNRLSYRYKYLKHSVDLQTKVDNMKEEIKDMKKEESVVAKANKQYAVAFDLNQLNRLPLEMVDIIESFIPYEIRNTLIEEKRPFRLFKNLTPITLKSFLMNICYTPEYLSLISEGEKQKYIYNPETQPVGNWNPDWLDYNKRKDIETRIKYIFQLFKKSSPKGAYKLMRMFLVLINPDKKYDKHDGSWLRLNSIPV
jgi:hypothetical protein